MENKQMMDVSFYILYMFLYKINYLVNLTVKIELGLLFFENFI